MNGTAPSNPVRDPTAGRLLKELREDLGLSRQDMPYAMLRAGIKRDHIPSIRTIYNVEELGQVPRVRTRFAIAKFFERDMTSIWPTTTRASRREGAFA
jgi:DNA-binding XRE family transcriptional regulator